MFSKGLMVRACELNAVRGVRRSCDSPTIMCSAEVTGSLVPTVAKQIQSVEPEKHHQSRHKDPADPFTEAEVCISEVEGGASVTLIGS